MEGDHLTESQLFSRWNERWSHFVHDFTSVSESGTISARLRDKVKNGNAERAIGQGQEGREVFELLQNARDAIQDEEGCGRVYIGVYDTGILVANTGAPFDLFDTEVEDAVTMIGESSKEGGEEEIGHKGVGLKSILAAGESFEIWTRHQKATDDLLRVRLSRAYITAALLTATGHEFSEFDFLGEPDSDDIEALLGDTESDIDGSLSAKNREELGKLPLFDFPVPLSTDIEPESVVGERAHSLLTDHSEEWYGDPFRTAVFVEFEDDDWDSIREEFDIPHPNPPKRNAGERADSLWRHLSRTESDEGLRPETLVQLGGVETLLVERVSEDESERQHWDVDRSRGPLESGTFDHQAVTVLVSSDEGVLEEDHFDQFSTIQDGANPQLLVPRESTDGHRPRDYPLYLYYPIDNTRDVELPYCLHGHFKVNTNRKDLSRNSLEQNQEVLARCITLVGRVAETSAEQEFGDRYPWILLPPPVEDTPESPGTQASLLEWLRGELLDELRTRSCVPVVAADRNHTAVSPDEALLHWNPVVRDGFRALHALSQSRHLDVESDDSFAEHRFPTRDTVEGWHSLPNTWESRIQALLQPSDPETYAEEVAQSWAGILGQQLHEDAIDDQREHLPCDADDARALLRGTVETILESGTEDDHLLSILETLSTDLDGVFLLPCRHVEEDEADAGLQSPPSSTESSGTESETLLLAPAESRSGPRVGRQRRTRSVFWDVEAPDRDLPPPKVPHERSSFDVYLLDRELEQDERVRRLLDLAGDWWGVRAYDNTPDYFRELFNTFAVSEPEQVKAIDFYFLADQIDNLDEQSADLQTDEGAFLPLEYIQSAVGQTEGDQRRNVTRRLALRNNSVVLPPDWEAYSIRDLALGNEWQRLRTEVTDGEGNDEAVDSGWETLDVSAWETWPDPSANPWQKIAAPIDTDNARQQLARTLSLLGVASLPKIRCLWMYGLDHPNPGDNPSWNPTEWGPDDYRHMSALPDQAQALDQILATAGEDYLEWITAPGFHPQDTAEHSDKCPVNVDGVLNEVQLATWVWLADPEELNAVPNETFRGLLHRFEDEYMDSILRTGWTCSNGHQREDYNWEEHVPTLLNWQLREFDVWDTLVDLHSDLDSYWEDHTETLSFAVAKQGERGPRAWRLFPHVDFESAEFSEDILRTLGVKPIEDFSPTEAAWHLQQLLEMLSVGRLDDEWTRLQIPGGRSNDWNAAYTALLTPILQLLPEEDPADADLDLPFLSHLPIQQNGEWRIASLEWIEANAENGRYYEDRSPKPWERQAVEGDDDVWLLPRTSSGPFSRLPKILGIDQVDEPKPIADPDDLAFLDKSVKSLQADLSERTELLASVVKRSGDEDVQTFIEDLETAIDELRVAQAIPTTGTVDDDSSSPDSGLYAPRESTEAFVLSASAFEAEQSLSKLANAVALLAEQPTEISIFREALDPRQPIDVLRDRWKRRTFPLEEVERMLGTRRRRRLRHQLDALVELAGAFDGDITVSVPEVLETLNDDQENDSGAFENVNLMEDADTGSTESTFCTDLQEALPSDLHFVLERVLGDDSRPWNEVMAGQRLNREREQLVIEWLEGHARAVEATACFPQSVLSAHPRTLAVNEARKQTHPDDLNDLETWETQIRRLSTDATAVWTDPLPEALCSTDLDGELLFYTTSTPGYRVQVVEPLISRITEDVKDDGEAAALEEMLKQYVLENTLPTDDSSTSPAAHQEDAFADLQSFDQSNALSTETLIDTDFDIQEAKTRTTSSGGGGSTQYQGRGQQGEAAVLVAILNDAAEWLVDQPRGTIRQFRSDFRGLRDESDEYDWHLDRVWEEELDSILSPGSGLTRDSILEWQETVEGGVDLHGLPFVRLCNVALEQGPGFDVIDPFGALDGDQVEPDQFVPVEVKTVNGQSPPFHFRLTTNEYRRCKAFARRDDRQYVIRLVYVPEAGTTNWIEQTSFVSEVIVESESDAESLVQGDPLEELVKGGYMNLSASSD